MSTVRFTSEMFDTASSFRGDGVDRWDTSQFEDVTYMFNKATLFNANLSNWNMAQAQFMSSMFEMAQSFTGYGMDQWNIRQALTMAKMLIGTNLSDVNLSNWDVSNVHDMSHMFQYATSYQGIGISDWDTSNVIQMEYMFDGATSFNASVHHWQVRDVVNMAYMFHNTNQFQGIGLDQWEISSTCTVDHMFCRAEGLNVEQNNFTTTWEPSLLQDSLQC
jgi:surface protein